MAEPKSAPSALDRKFRNRFLIFPKFQLALISMNFVIMFLVSGIIYYQISRAFSDLKIMGASSGMEAEMYNKYLAFQAGTVQSYLLTALVLAIVVSITLTLVISHRFAGPLVRLRGYFRNLPDCKGPLPKLSFRRGDFMSDLPPVINHAIDVIVSRTDQEAPATPESEGPRLRVVGGSGR